MHEGFNSVLPTPTEADLFAVLANTDISAKPKYRLIILARSIYRSICCDIFHAVTSKGCLAMHG